MKRRQLFYVALAALMLPLGLQAQRRTRGTKPKIEEPAPEDPRIVQMRAATQQVVFIDSVVVDRDDFLSHIPLSAHTGRLSQKGRLATFVGEMGDHRLATIATTDSTTAIVESDFIANRWTEPQPVEGLGEASAGFPFLMPDGITLYYAQKGEKSIGGYDLFVTRYDGEKQMFLRPENLGMPFSSEADDLFYAIDEFQQLGYFVTDRRQPRGKVCIYTFIPPESRRTYPAEAYSDEQMRALADINRIADTWTPANKQQRQEALARLHESHNGTVKSNKTSLSTLHSSLDSLRHQAEVLDKTLTLMRNRYATASEGERLTLGIKILNSERQLEQMLTEIRNREKQIPTSND